jgi:type I restriction enzyme M protein
VIEKYPDLAEDEVKDLVVDEKWLAAVENAVRDEIERITQQLSGRVHDLETRYAERLPKLESKTEELSETVDEHLKMMGLTWK